MSRHLAPLLLAVGVSLPVRMVHAQGAAQSNVPSPTERLVLHLDYRGAPGCVDAEAFRLTLLPKISDWNPIDDDGRWRLVVSVARRGSGFDGSAEVHDAQGTLVWSTTMPPPQELGKKPLAPLPCRTLLGYIAVVLATWMDPPEGFPKRPAPAAVCAAAPAPAGPSKCEDMTETALLLKPPPSEPTPPLPKPLSFQLATVTSIGRVTSNRADIGISLDLGIRYKYFGAAIQAHGDPPLGAALLNKGASANYARVAGALLACMHYFWLDACVKGQVNRVLALGAAAAAAGVYGAAGTQVALDFPVVPRRFDLRIAGEVLQVFKPPAITFKQQTR